MGVARRVRPGITVPGGSLSTFLRDSFDFPLPRGPMIPGVLCAEREGDGPVIAAGVLEVEPRGLGSGSLDCSTAVGTVPALLVVVVEVGIGETD